MRKYCFKILSVRASPLLTQKRLTSYHYAHVIPPGDAPDYTRMDIVYEGVGGDVGNSFEGYTWVSRM